jgi:hypothetical protein
MQQQPLLLATSTRPSNAKVARFMIACNPFSLIGVVTGSRWRAAKVFSLKPPGNKARPSMGPAAFEPLKAVRSGPKAKHHLQALSAA